MTERKTTDTIRLYETDAAITRFSTVVLCCEAGVNGYEVILDRTAFFPTGGGQPCDLGTLGGADVTEVAIRDGEILHSVSTPLAVGAEVEGVLDTARRRRHMAAHTAEHILSSVLFRRYGFQNVGFHVGHEDTTCDFDRYLDREALAEAEREVNAILRENHPVYAVFPPKEELGSLSYRSKLDLQENVRIVVIGKEGEIDRCACCAPHVTATGEVGLLTITDACRYKGGMRIHLLAGEEALARVQALSEGMASLSALLSAKPEPDAVLTAAERLLTENREAKRLLAEANTFCNEMICRLLPQGTPLCFFDSRRDVTALRHLALTAAEAVNDTVLVLGADGEESYRFVLCGENVKPIYEGLFAGLSCRGGGNDRMICGSLSASRQVLEAAVGNHFTVIG